MTMVRTEQRCPAEAQGRGDSGRGSALTWRYDVCQGPVTLAEYDHNCRMTRWYVRGVGVAEGISDIVAEVDVSGQSAKPHYYLYNHRGDVLVVLNPDGAANSTFRYDAFGNYYQMTGSFAPRYTFSTKEYLSAAGLYLYQYRVYDPIAGRWTQRDPIDYHDSINLYQFCGNNPVNATDTVGLETKKPQPLTDEQLGNVIYNENRELREDPNCKANESLSTTNKKMAGVIRNQEANLPEGRNAHAPTTATATTETEKQRLEQVKKGVKGATANDAPNHAMHFNHRQSMKDGQRDKSNHRLFGKVVAVSGSFVGAHGKIIYVVFYEGKKRP